MASEENKVQDGPVGSGMLITLAHLPCLIPTPVTVFVVDLHVAIIQSDHTVNHSKLSSNINHLLTF